MNNPDQPPPFQKLDIDIVEPDGNPTAQESVKGKEPDIEALVSLKLIERIDRLSKRCGCDASDIFRKALFEFLEEEERRLGIEPYPEDDA